KAGGLAARLELELCPSIGLVDLRLGDLRVRQELEAGSDRPLGGHLHPAATPARAGARPAGEPGASDGPRRERHRPPTAEAVGAARAAVDAGGWASHRAVARTGLQYRTAGEGDG